MLLPVSWARRNGLKALTDLTEGVLHPPISTLKVGRYGRNRGSDKLTWVANRHVTLDLEQIYHQRDRKGNYHCY
jgi:hypothetical protein